MSRPSANLSFWPDSRSFVSFVAALMLVAGCGRTPRHTSWQSATGAGEYERLMWRAVQQKDWKEFEYHLAPTFVGVNAPGEALDRNAWLNYWQQKPVQQVLLTDIETRPEGPDMVVTLVLHLSGPAEGMTAAGQTFRVLSVWQQVKRGWTLTATSLTLIRPE